MKVNIVDMKMGSEGEKVIGDNKLAKIENIASLCDCHLRLFYKDKTIADLEVYLNNKIMLEKQKELLLNFGFEVVTESNMVNIKLGDQELNVSKEEAEKLGFEL